MRQIIHVRLPQPLSNNLEENQFVLFVDENERVCSIRPMQSETAISDEDWGGDFLSPMAVDLQINGGLGLAFNNLSIADLPRIFELLDKLWLDGVEAICPTIISSTVKSLRNSLEVYVEVP